MDATGTSTIAGDSGLSSISQRPARADAARNYDKLIAAARAAFTEDGAAASLEDIARRAGVGIGTLYRNFATRQALLEAVYVDEVESICRAAEDLGDLSPWDALVAWLRSFGQYATTKKALSAELLGYLDADSEVFTQCRTSIFAAGEPLFAAAKSAGQLREDAQLIDTVRMVGGIVTIPNAPPDQIERILSVAFDGLRQRS